MQKTTVASAPDEVAALLREALAQLRTIRAAPPLDDTKTKLLIALDQLFKLTPAESRMLAVLLERGHVTREAMCAAVARDGKPVSIKVVSVNLGTLRKKLKPHGIEVITVWARGFRLGEGAYDRIHRLLAEHGVLMPAIDRPAAAPPD